MADEWIKHREAQKMLGVCRNTLKSMARDGLITYYIINGQMKFKKSDIEEYLEKIKIIAREN